MEFPPPSSPIGLWKSRIRFRAVFRVFSVNEPTVESMILPRRSNSRIRRRRRRRRRIFFFSKTLGEWTKEDSPRRNLISLSGADWEVGPRWSCDFGMDMVKGEASWIGLRKTAIEARDPIIRVNIRVFCYIISFFTFSYLIIRIREMKLLFHYGNIWIEIYLNDSTILRK